jgi:hypothetical protein
VPVRGHATGREGGVERGRRRLARARRAALLVLAVALGGVVVLALWSRRAEVRAKHTMYEHGEPTFVCTIEERGGLLYARAVSRPLWDCSLDEVVPFAATDAAVARRTGLPLVTMPAGFGIEVEPRTRRVQYRAGHVEARLDLVARRFSFVEHGAERW